MKRLISLLKKWNKVYPEHLGLLALRICDDESGRIVTFDNSILFSFHDFEELFSTKPEQYKKDNS